MHIARMPEHRIPKMALFGWLPKTRPPGGPRKRWRDQIHKDLKVVGISESEWYDEATCSREGWCATYRLGLGTSFVPQNQRQESAPQSGAVECGVCGRSFRRESDKKRHMCVAERSKPVWEQHGAVQCGTCQRWFLSRGGLSVHSCGTAQS